MQAYTIMNGYIEAYGDLEPHFKLQLFAIIVVK